MRGHEPQQFSVLCIGFSCNNIKQQIGGQHYELLFLERLLKFSRTAKQDCNWNLHFSSCLFFGTHLFQAKLKFKWNRISTINPSPKSFLDLISKIFFSPWAVTCITLYRTTGNRVGKTVTENTPISFHVNVWYKSGAKNTSHCSQLPVPPHCSDTEDGTQSSLQEQPQQLKQDHFKALVWHIQCSTCEFLKKRMSSKHSGLIQLQ